MGIHYIILANSKVVLKISVAKSYFKKTLITLQRHLTLKQEKECFAEDREDSYNSEFSPFSRRVLEIAPF